MPEEEFAFGKSRRTVKKCTIVVMLVLASAIASNAHDLSTPAPYDGQITRAMRGIERFKTSKSADDLLASSTALYGVVGSAKVNALPALGLISLRRKIVTSYAQIIHQIEMTRDPAFDIPGNPAYVAVLCPETPVDSNGEKGFSCIDPSFYKDAAIRAKYMAAIRANSEKNDRINYQRKLANADDEISSQLQASLRVLHVDSRVDIPALDAILEREGLSAPRRAVVHSMFEAR